MAVKENQFKNKPKQEKPTPRAKTNVFSRSYHAIKDFLSDRRLHSISGLFFLLLSVSLLLAFISYFFYWTIDSDKVSEPLNFVRDNQIRAHNWMGKFGAIVAEQFMRNWFGIGSFVIVIPLFVLGVRLMFKAAILPFFKTVSRQIHPQKQKKY